MPFVNSTTTTCGWNNSPRVDHDIRYVDLATYPGFLVMCTMGNAINVAVLSRERPVTPRKIYLLGIALADVIYMWSALFAYILAYDAEIYGLPRASVKQDVLRISGVMLYLQETAAIISSWLIVAFTVQRFVAIKYPLKHLISGTDLRFSVFVVVAIGTTASVWSSNRLVDYYTWFFMYHPENGQTPPRSRHLFLWHQTYTWGLAVIQISTFLIILILNTILFRVISAQQQHQREELQASFKSRVGAFRPERSAMVLLNACVILYLLTQWPVCLSNMVFFLEKACVRQIDYDVKSVLRHMGNILMNANFSMNFLVYCGADRRFRARLCSCTVPVYRGSYSHPRLSERTIILHSPHEIGRLMGRVSNSSTGLPGVVPLSASLSNNTVGGRQYSHSNANSQASSRQNSLNIHADLLISTSLPNY